MTRDCFHRANDLVFEQVVGTGCTNLVPACNLLAGRRGLRMPAVFSLEMRIQRRSLKHRRVQAFEHASDMADGHIQQPEGPLPSCR